MLGLHSGVKLHCYHVHQVSICHCCTEPILFLTATCALLRVPALLSDVAFHQAKRYVLFSELMCYLL